MFVRSTVARTAEAVTELLIPIRKDSLRKIRKSQFCTWKTQCFYFLVSSIGYTVPLKRQESGVSAYLQVQKVFWGHL